MPETVFHRWTPRGPKLFEGLKWQLQADDLEKRNYNDLALLVSRANYHSNVITRSTMEVTLYPQQPVKSSTVFRKLTSGVEIFAKDSTEQALKNPLRSGLLTAGLTYASAQEAAPSMNDLFEFFKQETYPALIYNQPKLAEMDERVLFNKFLRSCIDAVPHQDKMMAGLGSGR